MSAHRRRKSWAAFWIIAISGVVAWSGFAAWLKSGRDCIQASADSGSLLLNVRTLPSGAARKYCVEISDFHAVRLIVVRRSDGEIRVVLDACRTCYGNNLGYKLSKRGIVCQFCSNRYSMDSISTVSGSCAPLSVPFAEHGGLLKIRLSDLKSAGAFFPAHSPGGRTMASMLRWFDQILHKHDRRFAVLSAD